MNEEQEVIEKRFNAISPHVKELIRQCALKNDDARKSLPVNYLVNKILYIKHKKETPADRPEAMGIQLWNFHLFLTAKVLQSENIWEILEKTQNFKDFNMDNNPYKERDFGNFKVKKEGTYYFKFDYFKDNAMELASDNHLKDDCYRNLTIMHASEY